MPTEKPRILLTLDEKLIRRIDDFRFDNRINARSEAIRRLIEESLKKYEKKPSKKTT
jgi:metal-responsive CopG/Arc/MetJ family transcriptional regulator